MQTDQRILGYFIEEAKEHLDTIEQGLLNLQGILAESERLNEVFRAAHSVKGGAAMLGIHSIQQTAHWLEDYFKVLKEHPVKVDQTLESLFLRGFDTLRTLLEQLQGPEGLTDDVANSAIQEVEPVFAQLGTHLTTLVSQAGGMASHQPEIMVPSPAQQDETPLFPVFHRDVLARLRDMLQLFKQTDQPANRQQLQILCQDLAQMGEQFGLAAWGELMETAQQAIAKPQNSFTTLASILIREIKAARDQVLAGHPAEIFSSQQFKALATAEPSLAPEVEAPGNDWAELPFAAAELPQGEMSGLMPDLDLSQPGQSPSEPGLGDLEAILRETALSEEMSPVLSSPVIEPARKVAEPDSLLNDFAELEMLLQEATPAATQLSAPTDQGLRVRAQEAIPSPLAQPPISQINRQPSRGMGEQTMRVPVKHLDSFSNWVGELVINRNSLEQNQERLRQSLDNLLQQVQQLSDMGQQMQDLYERSLLEASLLATPYRNQLPSYSNVSGGHTALLEETRHATGIEFDALEMDRFTSFHTLSQEIIERVVRLREAASDIEFIVDGTDQVSRMFRQATNQLQDGLNRSRMVPFAQIVDRLPRAVRDIALKSSKRAGLEIEGKDTLIDKGILERLYDPMTHLVSNALIHGIESPEIRQASGKSPVGHIAVRAFYQGNQTIISVSDDGAGIDPIQVKAKALAKGLITPIEAQEMPQSEAYDLLFSPGFSTKDQVDDMAGRGVGMDVVRTSLNEIRGIINVDSTLGQGTTFIIRLPLTLSITKALCCIDNHYQVAFPMDGVEDILDIPKEQVQINSENQPFIPWRNSPMPFHPLAELLTYNRRLHRDSIYSSSREDDTISVVVLRSAGYFVALQVSQILGEQEIVIKQLSGPVSKPIGVAGVTILGDGRVMTIADVLELTDLAMERLRPEAGSTPWSNRVVQEEPALKTEPIVLIVDDSITVRELLSVTFKKAGYRVEQARDSQEAWEKLRSGLPCNLVFCDIEMPKMDGLELLSRIQQDANLQHLPVAMLTSRGAEKHRQMAIQLGAKGYFTKPYLEEALLSGAQRMLNGEVLVAQRS